MKVKSIKNYFGLQHYGLIRKEKAPYLSFRTCRFSIKWTDNHGLFGLPRYTERAEKRKTKRLKDQRIKDKRRAAEMAALIVDFSLLPSES
jgi:hypothetical protein